MRSLILKDLILNRKFLLTTGCLYIVYMGYVGSQLVHTNIYVPLSSFMIFILPLMLYAREDKYKASVLSCSLPTTRRDIVLSRYLTSWILMLLVYFLSTALVLVIPNTKIRAQELITPKSFFLALFLMTLFLGILLPLLIRFGTIALFVFLISLQLLGIILFQMWPRNLLADAVKALAASIKSVLFVLNHHLGASGYAVFLIGCLLLLNCLSFKCSEYLFRRKEL